MLTSAAGGGRRRAAARVGAANASGALLNAVKFLLLPTLLAAHELDVLAVGLLIAVTLSQSFGEPLATHSVVEPGVARARRITSALACILLVSIAVLPNSATALLAPGLGISDSDSLSIRLFALTGVALVGIWVLAGERQRRADFSGLGVLALVPNAALVTGALSQSLTGIALAMLGGCLLAGALLSMRAVRGTDRALTPPPLASAVGIADLVVLSLATQLNIVLVRVAGADLPEGSLGALFIALGVVTLPVIAVAGSAAAVSLPHWRSQRSSRPLREAVHVAILASLAAAVVLIGLALLDTIAQVREMVDPAVRDNLRETLPILVAGTPLHAAAWFLRALVITRGRTRALATAAALGALAVPAATLVADTVAAVAVGYVLSPIPWLVVAAGVAARAARGGSSP